MDKIEFSHANVALEKAERIVQEKAERQNQVDRIIATAEDILKAHDEEKRQQLMAENQRLTKELIERLNQEIQESNSDIMYSVNKQIKPNIELENIANNNLLFSEVKIGDIYADKFFTIEADKGIFKDKETFSKAIYCYFQYKDEKTNPPFSPDEITQEAVDLFAKLNEINFLHLEEMLSKETISKINLIRDFINYIKRGCEIAQSNSDLLLKTKDLENMTNGLQKLGFKIPEPFSKTEEFAHLSQEQIIHMINFSIDYLEKKLQNG